MAVGYHVVDVPIPEDQISRCISLDLADRSIVSLIGMELEDQLPSVEVFRSKSAKKAMNGKVREFNPSLSPALMLS